MIDGVEMLSQIHQLFPSKRPLRFRTHFMGQTTVDLDRDSAKKVLQLVDNLENDEDVQNVFGNYAIPDKVMATFLEAEN